MFIEITTIFADQDGAPTKRVNSLVNVNMIKSILPVDAIIMEEETEKQWATWNKTLINLVGSGCLWAEQPYDEIKTMVKESAF
jgi:hypothetical protein